MLHEAMLPPWSFVVDIPCIHSDISCMHSDISCIHSDVPCMHSDSLHSHVHMLHSIHSITHLHIRSLYSTALQLSSKLPFWMHYHYGISGQIVHHPWMLWCLSYQLLLVVLYNTDFFKSYHYSTLADFIAAMFIIGKQMLSKQNYGSVICCYHWGFSRLVSRLDIRSRYDLLIGGGGGGLNS